MERELSPKGRLLVRIWMYGPIFAVLSSLILLCVALVEPRSLAVLWVACLLGAILVFAVFAFKETGYRYYAPAPSRYLDLVVAYVIFAGVCFGFGSLSPNARTGDLSGILSLSGICTFFMAPHILFRAYRQRRNTSHNT